MQKKNQFKIGMSVYGQVTGIRPYGAFVSFENGFVGLIHISEISNGFVRDISSYIKIGDFVICKIIDIDVSLGQLRLSYKALKRNRRDSRIKAPFLGIPVGTIGFSSIRKKLPEWVKE